MRTEWKGTSPTSMTFRGKSYDNLSGWRSVLAVLAEDVLSQGRCLPPEYLKAQDNGHRTIPVRGAYLNVNLCNDDMITRVKALAVLAGSTLVVEYTLKGHPGVSSVSFGTGVVTSPPPSRGNPFLSWEKHWVRPGPFCTAGEIAGLLRVEEAVVLRLTSAGRIPHVLVEGDLVRFDPEAVISVLQVNPS